MKNTINTINTILVIILLGFMCLQASAKSHKSLLKKFATRVENHDINGVLALLDGSYKQVQLIGMLNQDTTMFLDQLFCGYDATGKKNFVCADFAQIKKCSYSKRVKLPNAEYTGLYANVYYNVETFNGKKIVIQLNLLKIPTSTGYLFRLSGTVG